MRRNVTTLADVRGKDIVAINGEKIGSVRDIFYDDASGEAEWVTVATGILGMKERVIPVDSLQIEGERLKVPFTKDLIKGEPDFNVKDGMLLPEDEARLCSHFGTNGRGTHARRVLRYGQEYRGM